MTPLGQKTALLVLQDRGTTGRLTPKKAVTLKIVEIFDWLFEPTLKKGRK